MSALVSTLQTESLPTLIDRAATALAGARSAAEVLEARALASVAYDAAKRASRLAKAKVAHDSIHAAALRSQADANAIIAAAQHRLADEYDAAQERGEVATAKDGSLGRSSGERPATAADIGLSRKDIHEARTVRDAETADPGVTRRTLDAMVDRREEPTRAALNRTLRDTAGRTTPNSPDEMGELFRRFLHHTTEVRRLLDEHGVQGLIADAGRNRAVLGQRANGLAALMDDIAEGLGHA